MNFQSPCVSNLLLTSCMYAFAAIIFSRSHFPQFTFQYCKKSVDILNYCKDTLGQ